MSYSTSVHYSGSTVSFRQRTIANRSNNRNVRAANWFFAFTVGVAHGYSILTPIGVYRGITIG